MYNRGEADHRRRAMDEKYLTDLRSLENAWKEAWANWAESGIWPLISPFVSYFKDEMGHLERTIEEITPKLKKLEEAASPAHFYYGEFYPGTTFDDLDSTYQKEQQESKIARRIDSTSVNSWHSKAQSLQDCLLLEQDRNYRRAVWKQHKAVKRATKWYIKCMPVVLENHQQRAEDIKSHIQATLTRYSEVSSDLSASCSFSISATAKFASTALISPQHDQIEREKSSILLQKAEYVNPFNEFRAARPLLGLGPEGLPSIVHRIIESYSTFGHVVWSVPEEGTWLDPAFELERGCMQFDLPTLLRERGRQWKLQFLHALFWSDLPLLVIADSDIKQYSGGVPRGQMKPLLDRLIPSEKQEILSMMIRLVGFLRQITTKDPFVEVSRDLTHREDAENIVTSIWRKWDVANNHVLPDGVERVWRKGDILPEIMWIKTGEPYAAEIAS